PNEDGTAYGDAALLAAAHLKAMEQKDPEHTPVSKIVVLLTDGENNCGRYLPLQAAAMARQWGIRIYTISIQAAPQPVKVDVEGETQLLPPAHSASDDLLRQMAEMTGGIFRTAYDFDSLQAVYREIDRLEKSRMKAITYTDYQEAFSPFVLAGIVLLFLQQIMNTFIFRVVP
ncbi:MAG: VWA domain-containing protein, partial [Lentisphaerae bacterium]